MGLIDMVKSAKNAIKQVAKDVSQGTFTENFGAAVKDTASKYGESQGFIENVGSAAASLATGGADVQKKVEGYNQGVLEGTTPRSVGLDILGTAISSPYGVSSGIKTVADSDKTGLQRAEGAMNAGFSAITATGLPLLYKGIADVVMPTVAKKYINDTTNSLTGDFSKGGQALGFSKEDSDAAANIFKTALAIGLTKLGASKGSSITSSVTKGLSGKVSKVAAQNIGKAAGITTDVLIQSGQDIIPMVYDYMKNNKDKPEYMTEGALSSLGLNLLGTLPLKGLKNRIMTDITDAKQTKMDVDTPEAKVNKDPIVVDKSPTDVNKPEKAEVEPTLVAKVEPVSDTNVVQDIDTPVTPVTSDIPAIPTRLSEKVKKVRQKKIAQDTVNPAEAEKVPQEKNTIDSTVDSAVQKAVPEKSVFEKFMETNPTGEKVEEANRVMNILEIGSDADKKSVKSNTTLTPDEFSLLEGGAQKSVPETPTSETKTTTEKKVVNPLYEKLDNIKNSLSLDNVYVSKSKNILNKAGTIGGYVEKGLSNVVGKVINLRNITQSARDSKNLFANAILEYVGVDKRTPTFLRKIEVKPEDVVGGVTPNESQKINSYDEVKAVIDDIIPNSIKNFIGDKKVIADMENQAKAEYLYEIHKDNPEKLNMIFTPEEQVLMKNSIDTRDKASSDLADYLVDQGLLSSRDMADDYVRYVVSEFGRSKMKLDEPVEIDINGVKYKFDNIDQAVTSQMARKAKGDNHTADSMEKSISSILKEKTEGLDKFRVHSPTVQILSYSMEIGKLLQNKTVLDNFRTFMTKDKNGLPTDEAKFIYGLFPDEGPSEKLENIIGINRKDTGVEGAIKNGMASITRGTSSAILAGRLGTFVQPLFSSVPKGAATILSSWKNAASPVGINDIKVSEILSANGFTPDYQVFDTSPSGTVMKGLHEAAKISSGTPIENPTKKLVALTKMRETLNENGMQTSSSPIDIVTNWEKWARDPKNKDAYLISQDKIQETLDWMGGSTIFNKSMNDTIRKTNFQALTGYVNGQVNKSLTDIGRLIGTIETGKGQQVDAAKRLTGSVAVWGLVGSLAYGYLKSQNPDATEEELIDMSIQYANRQAGNPIQGLYAVTSGVTSSPLSSGIGILKDALDLGFSVATGDEGSKVKADRLAESIIKLQGLTNTINTATEGSLSDLAAEGLGTVNTRDITGVGNAKGIEDSGIAAAAFNMRPQQMIQEFLYDRISDADIRSNSKIENPVIKEAVVKTVATAKDWIKGVMTPLSDLANAFTPDRVDYGRMQAIYDTYNKITPEDTLPSFLGKLGITDPSLQNIIANELNQINIVTKGTSEGGNILASRITETPGQQFISSEQFGKQMEQLEKENPYVYNRIIAGLTSISSENSRREDGFKYDANSKNTIKKLIGNSTPKDDAVIAAISGNNPNSTALAGTIWNAYQSIVGQSPTAEDTKKGIVFLDDIMKQVYSAGPWTTGLERSLALNSFQTLQGLNETAKQNGWNSVTDILKQSPFLEKALEAGLRYRGWIKSEPTTNTTTIGADGIQLAQPTVPQSSMNDSSLPAMKAAKFSIPKSSSSKVQDRKVRSLSEIVQQNKAKEREVLNIK